MKRKEPRYAGTNLRARLESVESRLLFAATAALSDDGRELTVSGTAAADSIVLTLDARAAQFRLSQGSAEPQLFPAVRVNALRVNLGDGDDRFEFKTIGVVRQSLNLSIDGGGGNDTILVRWADDGAVSRAGMTLAVVGGSGDDAIGVRIGAFASGASVSLQGDGGAGNDALAVQAMAPAARASLQAVLSGGVGDDTLVVYQSGTLAGRASAKYDLRGDEGNDSLTMNVAGRLVGRVECDMKGGTGNDQLSVDAMNASGRKGLGGTLQGGEGDDEFAVLARPGSSDVNVEGGGGSNTGLLVTGVGVRDVQQVREPSDYEKRTGPLPTFNPVLPTRTIDRDGRTVEYYSAGRSDPGKPVVVLLTGFGGDIDYWQRVPGELAGSSQVIAVNRPGYRGSSPAVSDYARTAIDDIREVVAKVAPGRDVVLVGHSLGGLYANLFARLHPTEVAGVVFVDATAPEAVKRVDDAGIPFGGLGDPESTAIRLEQRGYRQEIEGVVSLAKQVLAIDSFPIVPVISLRAGPADMLAEDPQGNAWYEALGALGFRGETRRVPDAGHNIQFDRPDVVVRAVRDVMKVRSVSSEVRKALTDALTGTTVPGIGGGLVIGSSTVGHASAGTTNEAQRKALRDDSLFHIGSCGKSMTATLAAILVERGLIRWDTTVGEVYPELSSSMKAGYAGVTLEELLNHRGGVGDFKTDEDATTYEEFQRRAKSNRQGRSEYMKFWLTSVAPGGARGEYSYSNIGYTLAGSMLERVAGKAFESLMTDNLFRPLGMKSVRYGTPQGSKLPDLLSPSGGVSLTMSDWAKYLRLHLGTTENGVRLLSEASLTKLHTPDPRDITSDTGTFRYGFGWRTADTPLGEALGHEGAVPGFYSRCGIILSRKIAVFSSADDLSESASDANTKATTAILALVTGGNV